MSDSQSQSQFADISVADLFSGVDLSLEVGDRPIPPPAGWWLARCVRAKKEGNIVALRSPKQGGARQSPFLMAEIKWVLVGSYDPNVYAQVGDEAGIAAFAGRQINDWPSSINMAGRSRLSDMLKAAGVLTKTTNLGALTVAQIESAMELICTANDGKGFLFNVFIDWQGSAVSEIFKDPERKDDQGNPRPLIHTPDAYKGARKFPHKLDEEGNPLPAREFKFENVEVAHAGQIETVTIFAEPRAGDIKAVENSDDAETAVE